MTGVIPSPPCYQCGCPLFDHWRQLGIAILDEAAPFNRDGAGNQVPNYVAGEMVGRPMVCRQRVSGTCLCPGLTDKEYAAPIAAHSAQNVEAHKHVLVSEEIAQAKAENETLRAAEDPQRTEPFSSNPRPRPTPESPKRAS